MREKGARDMMGGEFLVAMACRFYMDCTIRRIWKCSDMVLVRDVNCGFLICTAPISMFSSLVRTASAPLRTSYPYFVPRNSNGSLPVYTDIRNAGTRYLVLLRNIDGDANVSLPSVPFSSFSSYLAPGTGQGPVTVSFQV